MTQPQAQDTAPNSWFGDTAAASIQPRDRFRHNLARIMSERGVTQAGLARMMCVSRVAVHAWIWGTCFPETSRLLKLAQVLGVPVGALLEAGTTTTESENADQEAMLLDAFRKMPGTARLSLLADMHERFLAPSGAGTMASALDSPT